MREVFAFGCRTAIWQSVATAIQLEGKAVLQGSVPALLNPGAFLRSLGEALEKTAVASGKNTCAGIASLRQAKAKETGKQPKPESDGTVPQQTKADAEDAGKTVAAAIIPIPVVVACPTAAGQLAQSALSETVPASFPKAAGEDAKSGDQQKSDEPVAHEAGPHTESLKTGANIAQSGEGQAQTERVPLARTDDALIAQSRAFTAHAAEPAKQVTEASGQRAVQTNPVAQETHVPAGASDVANAVPEAWRQGVIAIEVVTGPKASSPRLQSDPQVQSGTTVEPVRGDVVARQSPATSASPNRIESRNDVPAAFDEQPAQFAPVVAGTANVQDPANHQSRVYNPPVVLSEEATVPRKAESAHSHIGSKVNAHEPMRSPASASPTQSTEVGGGHVLENEATVESHAPEAVSRNVSAMSNAASTDASKANVFVRAVPPIVDSTSHIAPAHGEKVQASSDRSEGAKGGSKPESESKKSSSKTGVASTGTSQSEKQFPNPGSSVHQQQPTAQREPIPTAPHPSGVAGEPGTAQNASNGKQTPVSDTGHSEPQRIQADDVLAANSLVHTARILEQPVQTEMRVALRTPETGNLEVRTFIRDGQAGAVIAVEKGDVRTALLTELPSLQATLKGHQLEVGQIAVTDYGGSYGSTGSPASGGGGQQQPARHANSASVAAAPNRQRDLDETQQSRQQSGLSVHA